MARFSFNNFNKERLFNFDTSLIEKAHPQSPKERAQHDDRYTNLEELYKRDGDDTVYQIKALYINTKSEFTPEAPVVALADTYVNAPTFQLEAIKSMIDDPNAVKAINDGYAGFYIDTYVSKQNKTCYKMIFCDVDPSDFEESDPDFD